MLARLAPVLAVVAVLSACAAAGGTDAGPVDAGATDTTLVDAGPDATTADTGPPDAGPPPPPRRFVTDAQGRALLFHGINVAGRAKDDPLRDPHIDAAGIAHLARDWGFDFVRLLIFWDALEPMPGVIDTAYLDRVETLVAMFEAEHVAVMLDMHQDVYAHRFCCDGAPDWAIRDDGEAFALQSTWSLNYLQPAVERAFDNFWDASGPDADLQMHYGDAWAAVAERFRGNPAVVGYDLMNEPSSGSLFDPVEALTRYTPPGGGTSRQFDEMLFAPFYQRMIDRIRIADPDGWIFYEPRFAAPANGSPSFLPVLADPRSGAPHVVYAPHLYSTTLEASHVYDASDHTITEWERQRVVDLARQDCPGVIGEFGLAFSQMGATDFASEVLAMADRQLLSWAYWTWDPSGPGGWGLFDATTGTDNPQAALFVRAYPRAIAGDLTSLSFDTTTRTLDFTFVARIGVTGPTEIVLPMRVYPRGADVALVGESSGSFTTTLDATHAVLSLTTTQDGLVHHVVVTPRP